MGYIYLAKGDSRLFLTLEIISGVIILGLNLLFYHLYGLNGLGISFIISYMAAVTLSVFVLKKKYQISFPRKLFGRMIITYSFVILSFLTAFITVLTYRYIAGFVVLALATLFSVLKLNELMDLKSFIMDKIKRKFKQ
jgi:PST family polysaccharide transporter